jgi:hypothetical protein
MNYKILMCGLLVVISMLMISTIVSAVTDIDDTLKVQFGSISNCTNTDGSYNSDGKTIIQIDNLDYTVVRYTLYCRNTTITAQYLDSGEGIIDVTDKISNDMEIKDDNHYTQGDTPFSNKVVSTITSSASVCNTTTTSTLDLIAQNLSYCYSSLQKIVALETTCIDNSGLAGEYRAKYDSCNKDYTDCTNSLTPLKAERDTLKSTGVECDKELSSTQSTLTNCNENKNTLTAEKNDYKTKSEQRIMYALGGAALAGIGVYMGLTKGKRNPDYTVEEQEMQNYE